MSHIVGVWITCEPRIDVQSLSAVLTLSAVTVKASCPEVCQINAGEPDDSEFSYSSHAAPAKRIRRSTYSIDSSDTCITSNFIGAFFE